jgi:ribonuclease HI
MGVDAICEAATPPTRAALDPRTESQFIRMITHSHEHACKNYVDEWDQDPEFGSFRRWVPRRSDGLWVCGHHVEQTKLLVLQFEAWLDDDESSLHNDRDSLHLYTDEAFRICAAFGWTLRDPSDQEIDSRSKSLGPFYTAFDGKVASIENEISALLRCRQLFNHDTVHSDSMAAIAPVQHNKGGPGQSRAVNVIRHIQCLRTQGKRLSISWINGHNGNPGNDHADALAGHPAEDM